MFSIKNKLLSNSKIYSLFSGYLEKKVNIKTPLWLDYKNDDIILDIGCGPANILKSIPKEVVYYGYDLSEDYIKTAKKNYEARNAKFEVASISELELSEELIGKVNYVFAIGVIHHISDEDVKKIFTLAKTALCKNGKFISMDNYFYKNQNLISKFLIKNDRGKYVRTEEQYTDLAKKYLGNEITITKMNNLLKVPYDHIFIEYEKKY